MANMKATYFREVDAADNLKSGSLWFIGIGIEWKSCQNGNDKILPFWNRNQWSISIISTQYQYTIRNQHLSHDTGYDQLNDYLWFWRHCWDIFESILRL